MMMSFIYNYIGVWFTFTIGAAPGRPRPSRRQIWES
jgi:hypothetical protein